MENRILKVGNRYRELTGKPFVKIAENKLTLIQVIDEIEKSIAELTKEKPTPALEIQKLQRMLVLQKQNLNMLNRRFSSKPQEF